MSYDADDGPDYGYGEHRAIAESQTNPMTEDTNMNQHDLNATMRLVSNPQRAVGLMAHAMDDAARARVIDQARTIAADTTYEDEAAYFKALANDVERMRITGTTHHDMRPGEPAQFTMTPGQAAAMVDVLADHNDGEPVTVTAQGDGSMIVAFSLATVEVTTEGTLFDA
jgi:hypothetical protein